MSHHPKQHLKLSSWESCFCVNREKKSVFRVTILWILKLLFEDWPSSWIFTKEFVFCSKSNMSRLSKESFFCWNDTPEIHIFNSWRHQKLLSANQLQDSTFLLEINSEDIGISKLVSQLTLLPSLFELKDNGIIVMISVIKKLQDMLQNRSFLTREVGKIVRLRLLSRATTCRKWRHLFSFEVRKSISQVCENLCGNNRLHALMLVHVHNNILDDINLADVANQFVDRKNSRKQTFRHVTVYYHHVTYAF